MALKVYKDGCFCTVPDCENPEIATGLCPMHYSRFRKHGSLDSQPRRVNTIDDLWGRVDKDAPNGCWNWTAAINAAGYGVVGMAGKVLRVHRVIYEHARGPIPEKLVLDHLCRNTACCNPDHLEAVTDAVNFSRGNHWAAVVRRTGLCRSGLHAMAEHAYVRSNGTQFCKPCQNLKPRRKKDA
jgi:hypothetical protein